VGLAVVLLAGAGMLVESLRNLRRLDPGFVAEGVVTARLAFVPNLEQMRRLNRLAAPLAERLAAMPGVRAAAISAYPMISRGSQVEALSLPGRPARQGEQILLNHVTAGFFETYRIPLLAGRPVEARDGPAAPKIAVINDLLARRYFGAESPLGRTFSLASPYDPAAAWQVVGIVGNTKYRDLRQEMPPQVYVPLSQSGAPGLYIGARPAGGAGIPAELIREALARVDPSTEIQSTAGLSATVEASLHQERMLARLGLAFSLLALALAWTGVYGTMSYAVAGRTREIGLRAALGATGAGIQVAVLLDALRAVAAGIVVGLPVAFAAGGVIRGLLYGVEPGSPGVLMLTAAATLAVAVAAAWLPARAASRVDPMVALRAE
jgi:predicted permease